MKEEIIDKLLDYVKVTEDFLIEQAPEVIQQALRYETISAMFGVGLGTLALIASIGLFWYWAYNPNLDGYGDWTGPSIVRVIISGTLIIPLIGMWIPTIFELIKLLVAPKYYLIQLILEMRK